MATKPGIPKGTRDFFARGDGETQLYIRHHPRRLCFVWFPANRDACHGEPFLR